VIFTLTETTRPKLSLASTTCVFQDNPSELLLHWSEVQHQHLNFHY